MNRLIRGILIAIGGAGVLLLNQAMWAAPSQNPLYQTIPTLPLETTDEAATSEVVLEFADVNFGTPVYGVQGASITGRPTIDDEENVPSGGNLLISPTLCLIWPIVGFGLVAGGIYLHRKSGQKRN